MMERSALITCALAVAKGSTVSAGLTLIATSAMSSTNGCALCGDVRSAVTCWHAAAWLDSSGSNHRHGCIRWMTVTWTLSRQTN